MQAIDNYKFMMCVVRGCSDTTGPAKYGLIGYFMGLEAKCLPSVLNLQSSAE